MLVLKKINSSFQLEELLVVDNIKEIQHNFLK